MTTLRRSVATKTRFLDECQDYRVHIYFNNFDWVWRVWIDGGCRTEGISSDRATAIKAVTSNCRSTCDGNEHRAVRAAAALALTNVLQWGGAAMTQVRR